LVRVEGIATTSLRSGRRLLGDRRRRLAITRLRRLLPISALLLAIAALRLIGTAAITTLSLLRRLVIVRRDLHRRRGRDAWLGGGGGAGPWLCRTALQLAEPLFKLAIAVLQFFVLAGELAQLVFELLDAHFRIAVIGLRPRLRRQCKRRQCKRRDGKTRGKHRNAGQLMKSG
jgi:hypothetical protein